MKQGQKEVPMRWSRSGKKVDIPLKDYLKNEFDLILAQGDKFKVAIGTDSQRHGRGYKFATIILIMVYRDFGKGVVIGKGGKIVDAIYHMDVYKKNKEGVNERMLIEVGKSIEVAYQISDLLDEYGVKLEIHADINPDPKWASNTAMSEAIGYILGMGYDFKLKPLAFAASFCADHHAA